MNTTQWIGLAGVLYLLGSCVAATMAWGDERDFRAEFPGIPHNGTLLSCLAAGVFSWLSVAMIWDQRREDAARKAGRE
jgi:hypothetical protein